MNRSLLFAGDSAQSVWAAIYDFLSRLFSWIDALLNPVLSPLLSILNPAATLVGDLVYAILGRLPPWLGLSVVSVVIGVVMLVAFRHTSNQQAIARAKDDIKANLLALKLFKDQLRVTVLSQVRILWAILRLQRYVLTPVLWMAVPMMLVLAQMGLRHQWRPLPPDARAIVRVYWANAEKKTDVSLVVSGGAIVEAGPIPGPNDLVWRIRTDKQGRYTLNFKVDHQVLEKELVVGDQFQRVSFRRPSHRWVDQLLHPAEAPIPKTVPIAAIDVEYAGWPSWVWGEDFWVVTFFVISMAAALLLKPLFRVRF